ncbi:hypothetical protein [Phenylobacterium montanum]|uniref:Uncharacterized protein n=1 Tax=Phenylobacterium montanum TaxID=2823693 RepID=A0A975G1A7_9CAUL|nr:hypothetical protein [Caulobacter sp. S6]QUD89270.1 hypothetical protein KCG34_05160 [Caulobacter sp. S6]
MARLEKNPAGDGIDLPATKARGAEHRGLVFVLGISLGLAIVVLGLIWLFGVGVR